MPTSRYGRSFLGPDPPQTGLIFLLLSALITIGGVYHAAALGWLSDDIFITFRYIDQWFAGNGLVYNPGEYVEGYTHPLWLLLLSGWRLLGFDMISGSVLFGVIAQGLLLLTLTYASWKLAGRAALAFPASAAAIALHHDASVWATSGLETGFFTFLVALSVVLLTIPDIPQTRRLFVTGLTLVLATLMRPDGVLILCTVAFVVVVRAWATGLGRVELKKQLFWFALPSSVFVPYALWKLSYYGDLLPNTYYAKSGGGSYFDRGFTYVWLYLEGHPSTIVGILSIVALLAAFRRSGTVRSLTRTIFSNASLSTSLVSLLVSLVYVLFFVCRVGGDFMYARFVIPVVPLVYLAAESGLRYLFNERRVIVLSGLVVLPLLVGTVDVWARDELFRTSEGVGDVPGDGSTGIIDENYFWARPVMEDGQNAIVMLKGVGERLRTYFDGLTVRILIHGQACLAYYSKATEVIENWGLTDPFIAHLEIKGRGRVGHEKAAPTEYIVARRVHFFFFKDFTPSDTSFYRIAEFDLPYGWSKAEMYFYDRDLMRALAERFPDNIRFVDFERYLDDYLLHSSERSTDELENDFDRFKSYYFNHNFDPEREKRFVEAMRNLKNN